MTWSAKWSTIRKNIEFRPSQGFMLTNACSNAEEETANPNANGPRDETVGAEPVPMVSIDGTVSHAVEKDGEPKIVETVTASHGDEM